MTTMKMPIKSDLEPSEQTADLRITHTEETAGEAETGGPRIDAEGNFCHGFEYIDVPLRAAVRAEAFVLVAEDDGRWLTGWGWDPESKTPTPEMPSLADRSEALNVSRPRFDSRGSAIAHALRQLEQSARLWSVPMGELMAEDIASLHNEEYADWAEQADDEADEADAAAVGEILDETGCNDDEEAGAAADPATLAEQPDADEIAEYQDGVAGLESQGLTVGEPIEAEWTAGNDDNAADDARAVNTDDGPQIVRGIPDIQPTYRQQLREAADAIAETTLAELVAAAEHKTAKANRQLAAERLQMLVARGPQSYPLWESEDNAKTDPAPAAATDPIDPLERINQSIDKAIAGMKEKDRQAESTAGNSEEWQSEPIESLELPKGVTETLQGAGIDTIGRLEQRRADISTGREVWPRGIGEAKITKIENAVIAWLTAHGPQAS